MKLNRRRLLRNSGLAALALPLVAQRKTPKTIPASAPSSAPVAADRHFSIAADETPLDTATSELRPVIERYDVELRDLGRVYPLQGSVLRREKYENSRRTTRAARKAELRRAQPVRKVSLPPVSITPAR